MDFLTVGLLGAVVLLASGAAVRHRATPVRRFVTTDVPREQVQLALGQQAENTAQRRESFAARAGAGVVEGRRRAARPFEKATGQIVTDPRVSGPASTRRSGRSASCRTGREPEGSVQIVASRRGPAHRPAEMRRRRRPELQCTPPPACAPIDCAEASNLPGATPSTPSSCREPQRLRATSPGDTASLVQPAAFQQAIRASPTYGDKQYRAGRDGLNRRCFPCCPRRPCRACHAPPAWSTNPTAPASGSCRRPR